MNDQTWRWLANITVVICASICICNFIVQAFRFARWLVDKLRPEPPEPPSPSLKPGYCECGHERCCHERGVGACDVLIPADEKIAQGTCACQIYIFDPDEDGDDNDETPEPEPDPSVKELERISSL